jgi:hypothetical protein
MTDELKPPVELGVHGRRLWLAIVSEAKESGFRLDAMEREQLFSACRIRDTIAALEDRLAGMDLVIPGSKEQWVVNGLVTEIRLHRQLISQTLARLSFPAEDSGSVQIVRSASARAAANKRWRG